MKASKPASIILNFDSGMHNGELIPHLFRTEYRKIISVLCRRFGFDQFETAEDIASDTFLTAAQSWGTEGLPQNPAAWLYLVAANKAKNYLKRQHVFDNKISGDLRKNEEANASIEIDLSPQNIQDSQLQMMFAICHPSIATEAQIGLSLRVLCGFGIEEIADAFISNKETINKRLFRAKEKLREAKVRIELPPEKDLDIRLNAVLATIYLLFNEGYYSASQNKTIRKELCIEAMRLCTMLVENKLTNKPQVNALLSLMCFHASRFESRIDKDGALIFYEDQDTGLWNTDLISKGGYFLHCATRGDTISKYHLEAGIAYWHTVKTDSKEKWMHILQLYDRLLQIDYSPIAALNRVYAYSKVNGKSSALAEAEKLELNEHYLYYALLGDLCADKDNEKAEKYFQKSITLAKTETAKQAIWKKMNNLRL